MFGSVCGEVQIVVIQWHVITPCHITEHETTKLSHFVMMFVQRSSVIKPFCEHHAICR